jgi:phosphoribosyl 1,2-cyclic phosphodiesterase
MPTFTITYWGVTGGMPAALAPAEVMDKIVRAIAALVEQGRLQHLTGGPDLPALVRQEVERLPFALRSTYGGNTTCVEVQTADALLILDCGSGLRQLSVTLEQRWNAPGYRGPREAHLILTHPHIDHVMSAPLFDCLFDPRNRFTLWAPRAVLDCFHAAFEPTSPLSRVFYRITLSMLQALRDTREVQAGSAFTIGSNRISTLPLRHPGGCVAYRIESSGRSFVFATDHEHAETPDPELAAFARSADLLYADGQYLRDEYEGKARLPGETQVNARRGWGHSWVEACVATAVAAGVRELHVGHREPKRSDDDLARVEEYLQQLVAAALRDAGRPADSLRARLPYEGLTVAL